MTLQRKQRFFIGFILVVWILVPAITVFAGTVQYTYDDMDRLIRAEYENGTAIKYGYDKVGNRLQGAVTTSGGSCEDRTVCNGDFEQEFSYWESTANATIVPGRSGEGVEVEYDGANNDISQLLPGVFEANKTYRVTAWCLADVGEQCGLFFGDSNDAYGPPYEHAVWQWVNGDGAWQAIAAELTLGHEERLNVYLYSNVSGSAVIYDDVHVEEVTSSLLTFTKTGTGTGTLLMDDQECGPECEELQVPYVEGQQFTLQAIPDADSQFVEWQTPDGRPIEEWIFYAQPGDVVIAVFEPK